MNYYFLIVILLVIIEAVFMPESCAVPQSLPSVKNGIIDLSSFSYETLPAIPLNGNWQFFRSSLKKPDEIRDILSPNTYNFISVPGYWNDHRTGIHTYPGIGYATYRLKILLPKNSDLKPGIPNIGLKIPNFHCAYKLYADSLLIAQNGNPAYSAQEEIPCWHPRTVYMFCRQNLLTLTLLVSNHTHKNGGFPEEMLIGSAETIKKTTELNFGLDIVLCSILVFSGLYHLCFYFMRSKEKALLYFSIFSLMIGTRILFTNERIILDIFKSADFYLCYRLEIVLFYLSLPILALYLQSLFPEESGTRISKILIVWGCCFAIFVTVLPVYHASFLVSWHKPLFPAGGAILLFTVIKAAQKQRKSAGLILLCSLALFATGINDLLWSMGKIQSFFMFPIGVFIFTAGQSVILARRFTAAYSNIELLTEKLQKTNSAYSKFFPAEFLKLLNHKNIIDVSLGDCSEREMTILFSDIRGFTTLSEQMSPRENFDFLNSYLKSVGPVIRKNNGFIDKYIGDAIMALFPGSPDDALNAAVDMLACLESHNKQTENSNQPKIRIGIGIHTGNLMLGTIGEEMRMDGTVIADAVNLASRIEGLTKQYNSQLLVTRETFDRLKNAGKYPHKIIDRVSVKGKSEKVSVIEIIL